MSTICVNFRSSIFFFFTATAPTEIYTLSLHDALPIYYTPLHAAGAKAGHALGFVREALLVLVPRLRSEEHTSELQSPMYLVCRLLLEKKNPAVSAIIPAT